jgi:hypothetical protein
MANIQNPATVITLLKNAKGIYQKVKPDAKGKPELRYKAIVKDLQRLLEIAREKSETGGAKLVKPFNARKKILLQKLTEHRKKINSAPEKNADFNKGQLYGFTKALVKCTLAILHLDFNTLKAEEETGVNLADLPEGDPAAINALDALSAADLAALEQEDNAELPETGGAEIPTAAKPERETPVPAETAGQKESRPEARPVAVDGVAVLKRFFAMTGDYQTAVARPGPHVAVLQTQQQQVRGFLDARDFAAANKAMDQLGTLLTRIQSETGAKPVSPTPPPDGASAIKKRLDAMLGDIKTALAGPKKAPLQALLVKIQSLINNKDFVQANKVLDQLAPLLKPAPRPSSPWQPTLPRWRNAREQVGEQIGKVQSFLKGVADPLAHRVADQGLNGLTQKLEVGLEVALMELDNANDETRPAAQAQAQVGVAALRRLLQTHPALPLLDSNPFGISVSIRSTLGSALDDLEKALTV